MTLSSRCGGPSRRMGAKSGDHAIVALGQVRQHRDAEAGPAGFSAVGAIERVDREVRQDSAVDQRRRQTGRAAQRDRTKEERDRHRCADRIGHGLFVGVEAVDPAVVPWQPHQLPRRHVGDRDDQLVALLGGQAVVAKWPDRRTCARRDSSAGCAPSRVRSRPCRRRSPAAPPTTGRAPAGVQEGRGR